MSETNEFEVVIAAGQKLDQPKNPLLKRFGNWIRNGSRQERVAQGIINGTRDLTKQQAEAVQTAQGIIKGQPESKGSISGLDVNITGKRESFGKDEVK